MSAVKDRAAIGSADWVREQVYWMFAGTTSYPYIRAIFPETVVIEFEDGFASRLWEYPWSLGDDSILMLGEAKEVSVAYVAKRQADRNRASTSAPAELTGPIVRKDTKRQVAYAAVLVPGEPDSDGEVLTAEKIEEVAHGWLEGFRHFDSQHDLQTIDAVPVESYVTPVDSTYGEYDLPAGTWVLASKIRDIDIWGRVEKGELTGYSIMGVSKTSVESAMEAVKASGIEGSAFKRTLLADLGDDWVAPLVSIVDSPAVPKAKFFALKQQQPAKPEPGVWSKIGRLIGGDPPAEKAGRKYSDATYRQLKAATEALGALLAEADSERSDKSDASQKGTDMTPEEITAAVAAAVKSELEPVTQRLDALEKAEPIEAELVVTEDDADISTLKAEIETLKTANQEHEAFKSEIEKRLKPTPQSLTGQDGADGAAAKSTEDDEEYTDSAGVKFRRDASGRARPVI